MRADLRDNGLSGVGVRGWGCEGGVGGECTTELHGGECHRTVVQR